MQTREEFWRGALSDFVQSGQSMLQYCRERQLSYQCALHWRRRLNAPERLEAVSLIRLMYANERMAAAPECP